MDTRFLHLKLAAVGGALGSHVTVAMRPTVGGGARLAFAFCSPRDQWSRKKGRLIAEGRLGMSRENEVVGDRQPRYAIVPFKWDAPSTFPQQVLGYLRETLSYMAPRWLRDWFSWKGLDEAGLLYASVPPTDNIDPKLIEVERDALGSQLLDVQRDCIGWRKAATKLYQLLDDIDTNDDFVRDDDKSFRTLARAKFKERFKVLKQEGEELSLAEPEQPQVSS